MKLSSIIWSLKPKTAKAKQFIYFEAMRIFIFSFLLVVSLFAQNITHERKISKKFKDTLCVKWLDPRFGEFPDASLVDFSFLLKPPAGQFGFVKVEKDGHFYFEKTGKRIRFWGVTIAGSHIDVPKEKIKTVVEVLARSGCNIIQSAFGSFKQIRREIVSIVGNRGQILEKISDKKFALKNQGGAPVQTYGEKSDSGIEIWKGDKRIIKCFMKNGSFKIVIERGKKRVFVFCDVPNTKFEISGEFFKFREIMRFYQEIGGQIYGKVKANDQFIYPGFSKYVMIY